jgi:hypothetical protein
LVEFISETVTKYYQIVFEWPLEYMWHKSLPYLYQLLKLLAQQLLVISRQILFIINASSFSEQILNMTIQQTFQANFKFNLVKWFFLNWHLLDTFGRVYFRNRYKILPNSFWMICKLSCRYMIASYFNIQFRFIFKICRFVESKNMYSVSERGLKYSEGFQNCYFDDVF